MNYKLKVCIVFGLMCIITSSGCVVTKVHTMPVADFNAPYDAVWDSVMTYLNREKEPILVSDKEKGVISTDWVIMEKVFDVKRYKYDVFINKAGDNIVHVGIVSPQQAYDMGDWEDALPTERRAQRIFSYIKSSKNVKGIKNTPTFSGGVSKRPFNKPRR